MGIQCACIHVHYVVIVCCGCGFEVMNIHEIMYTVYECSTI